MSNVTSPLISIIMPIYNGADLIEATLASIREQDYQNYELLCIDDHSPDHSADIVQRWRERDPRIRYVKTHENLGIVAKVMNFAANHVAGDYFVYTSQDDSFSRDWLSSMVAVQIASGADVIVSDLHHVRLPPEVGTTLVNHWRDPVSGRDAFVLSLDWTIPGNALWPIHYLKDIGFEDFGTYADEYTVRKFFLMTKKVAFAPGVFRYFHGNPNAITKKITPKLLDAPFNEFRLWQLVSQTMPGSRLASEYAHRALASLVEATVRLQRFPALRAESARVEPAIAGMQGREFRSSLRGHYRSAAKRHFACALSQSDPARRGAAMILRGGRAMKSWLRSVSGEARF